MGSIGSAINEKFFSELLSQKTEYCEDKKKGHYVSSHRGRKLPRKWIFVLKQCKELRISLREHRANV